MKIKNIKKSDTEVSFEILIDDEWQSTIAKAKKELTEKLKKHDKCQCEIEQSCDDKCNCQKNECHCETDNCHCECVHENKTISNDEIYNYSINLLESKFFKMLTESKEFQENREHLLELPGIFVKNVNEKECVIDVVFDTRPEITLPSFDDFKLEAKQAIVIDAKDVEAELQALIDRSKKTVEIKEDKKLEKGDIANINFEGKIEGKPFDGGKGENFDLTIGSNQFIPGFEDQLIGMKKNDVKDIEVTFPKDYHAKEYANKKAIFNVKLNAIKKEEAPILNDDFVKELKVPNVETVEQLKTFIENFMKEQKEIEQESNFEKKVMEHLSKTILSHEPKIMKSKMLDQIKKQQIGQLAQYGISFDQYLEMVGQDKEKVMAELEKEALKQSIITVALSHLIKINKIEVTDEDLNKEIEHIAKLYNIDSEIVKQQVPMDVIKSSTQTKKILNKIITEAQNKK